MKRSVDEITGNRRMRRNRRFEWNRRLMRENVLSTDDLIWPVFLCEGTNVEEPLEKLPGVHRYSVDRIGEQAKMAQNLGIPAIATFANVALEKRDQTGSEVLNPDNIINQATKAIKDAAPDVGVITDVALDLFTDHGHDGIYRDGIIVNDETVERLAEASVLQAEAGADIVSASEMMDGRMGAIRDALNSAGYEMTGTLAYTAKYASGFYGPYREAVGTEDLLKGDKRTYFMDPANSDEAIHEAYLDISEGADMIMVKPGMPYLDIIRRLKDEFQVPTLAYQVSGEYSMIMAAAEKGYLEEERVILESLLCFKRAGADAVLTYFAPRVAEMLNG
ncbi:MAG: porphobilinogen synthase [Rhizobiaceae bacterium]|nr:porphobilinogen synthase [Rhizobiaceae bacterium]